MAAYACFILEQDHSGTCTLGWLGQHAMNRKRRISSYARPMKST
jgi:hypothetical protein